jgi:hypothetical protein
MIKWCIIDWFVGFDTSTVPIAVYPTNYRPINEYVLHNQQDSEFLKKTLAEKIFNLYSSGVVLLRIMISNKT